MLTSLLSTNHLPLLAAAYLAVAVPAVLGYLFLRQVVFAPTDAPTHRLARLVIAFGVALAPLIAILIKAVPGMPGTK